jgi:hypothetical protein
MTLASSNACSRRHFLRAPGGASTAIVTVAAAPAPTAEAYDPGHEQKRPRYREIEDVQAFYRKSRH